MTNLSVIIPTCNERGNIGILLGLLENMLQKVDYEIIVVDDSSDGTHLEVEKFQKQNSKIQLLHRCGKKGLSSAVIDGVFSTSAKFIAVMDADLQHDENLLTQMLSVAKEGFDVVVGSRFLNSETSHQIGMVRLKLTSLATQMAKMLFDHDISDPLSGFFLMKRNVFVDRINKLDGRGFKILLDVLSVYSKEEIRIKEIPYTFKTRQRGNSKLTLSVISQFLSFFLKRIFNKART